MGKSCGVGGSMVTSSPVGADGACTLGYPYPAYKDTVNVWDTNILRFQVSGLTVGQEYDFVFYGLRSSSIGGTGPRWTKYSIGATTVYLDAWDNADEVATIASVLPDANGMVEVTVASAQAEMGGNGNGYLNVLEIRGTFETVLIPNDCYEVWLYGQGLQTDFNKDCYVDIEDLVWFLNYWLQCYDPDTSNCP